jgi:HEAT repeat protein
MYGHLHRLSPLVLSCLLAAASGCAATFDGIAGFVSKPWQNSTEKMLNIKTPEDRIKELAELADTAKKRKRYDQDRISAELAEEIRSESDPVMRRHILRTLAVYPTPLALAVLKAGLRDSDLECRRTACESLGVRGGRDSAEELARVLGSDTEKDVRVAAVRGLGQTGDRAALVPLAEVLTDPDPALQFQAFASLRELSDRDFGTDVQAWREYANTGKTNAPEVSIAEKVRRALF